MQFTDAFAHAFQEHVDHSNGYADLTMVEEEISKCICSNCKHWSEGEKEDCGKKMGECYTQDARIKDTIEGWTWEDFGCVAFESKNDIQVGMIMDSINESR